MSVMLDMFTQLEPCYALFSGGKDSFSTARYLSDNGMLLGCVGLRTGISTPDWERSAQAICDTQGWKIRFYDTTSSYENVVRQYGFPGSGLHGMFMNYLKGRAIRAFKRANPGCALASGVRQMESARRALSTKVVSRFEGVKVFAPIYDWSTQKTWDYAYSAGYVRPLAYSTLQISGDCLCGAFARPDEREAIRYWYPSIDARLCALEQSLDPADPKSRWGWDNGTNADESLVCVECGRLEYET